MSWVSPGRYSVPRRPNPQDLPGHILEFGGVLPFRWRQDRWGRSRCGGKGRHRLTVTAHGIKTFSRKYSVPLPTVGEWNMFAAGFIRLVAKHEQRPDEAGAFAAACESRGSTCGCCSRKPAWRPQTTTPSGCCASPGAGAKGAWARAMNRASAGPSAQWKISRSLMDSSGPRHDPMSTYRTEPLASIAYKYRGAVNGEYTSSPSPYFRMVVTLGYAHC